ADDLGAMDFFAESLEEAGTAAGKKEEAFARGVEEAQKTALELKQKGFCGRIARRAAREAKHEGAYSGLVGGGKPRLASVTRECLPLEGFDPRLASNRDELVAELRKQPPPDLLLLDVQLPDADGFEILATLRRHPALKGLPVILLTAKTTKEDVMHGLILGADGYVTKPFEFEILVRAMQAVLGQDEEAERQGD